MKPIPVSWWEDIFGEIVLTRQTLVIVCHSHGSVNKQCLNICSDKVITFFSGERKFQNGLKRPCAACHRFGSNSAQESASMSVTQQPKKHDSDCASKCQVGEQKEQKN